MTVNMERSGGFALRFRGGRLLRKLDGDDAASRKASMMFGMTPASRFFVPLMKTRFGGNGGQSRQPSVADKLRHLVVSVVELVNGGLTMECWRFASRLCCSASMQNLLFAMVLMKRAEFRASVVPMFDIAAVADI